VSLPVFICWLSLLGLFYIYLGYPLLISLLARLAGRPVRKGAYRGSVSVLISVHNEAAKLGVKLQSLLASEAADGITEVLVGSDGSSDDVALAIDSVADPRVTLVSFAARRGKPSVLNDLMARCGGEVVVLTDARQPLESIALRALLENFADPDVGVVSGELVFTRAGSDSVSAHGVDAYWRYEKFIRKAESAFRSVPGATGALYAIRRELLAPIPPETLLDDVAIPMGAVLRGRRCVFEERAVVYDAPTQRAGQEAIRKRRTIAGNAQLVRLFPRLLLPWRNPIWFEFVSHKLLRLASPFLLLCTLLSSWGLRGCGFYSCLFAAQAVFYTFAALGWVLQKAGLRIPLVGAALMFTTLNLVTLTGLYDAWRGRFTVQWKRDHGTDTAGRP